MKNSRLQLMGLLLCLVLAVSGFKCNQAPQPGMAIITNAIPSVIPVRNPATVLTVYGSNFVSGAQLLWGGSPRQTNVISPMQLSANLLATDFSKSGSVLIAVAQNATVSNTFTIVITPAQLVITTASCPAGQVGVAYTCTLTAIGGVAPYTWTATGTLPAGLTLSTGGVLSGSPTTPGTFSFTVTVTDSAGSLPAKMKVQGATNKS